MNRFDNCNRRVVLAVVLCVCGSGLGGADEEPPKIPEAAHAVPAGIPKVGLSSLPDAMDEESFLRSIRVRSQELATQAEAVQDAVSGTELYLAAANLVIAHELEPYVSRMLLGIEEPNDPAKESQAVEDILNRMETLLSRVELHLTENKVPVEVEQGKWRTIKSTAEQVRAFADAIRAYLIMDETEEGRRKSRRAASGLSVLLENADPATATSAILWQALLRSRESDFAPAIAMLDHALADLPRPALREAFFARLLRCKLVARQGGWAAAVALLTQMTERCEQWFGDPRERSDAMRTVAWVQLQILRDWRDQYTEESQAPLREWCSDRLESIAASAFGANETTLLRLQRTVPIVAPAPPPPGKAENGSGGG